MNSDDRLAVAIRGRFSFSGRDLFSNIELILESGSWSCLLGSSGVGKSTLMRLIAGLETGGRFDGKVEASDGLSLVGRVAYMSQADLLLPWLSVRQNISLGCRLRGESTDETAINRLVESIGLSDHQSKKPAQLSGGMRQRTALARVLMEDAPLVLLDEPFSALDARTRAEMQHLAYTVLEGRTVLLVTHDPAEAMRLAHDLYVLSPGGLTKKRVPSAQPIRALDDAEMLQAQAELLMALHNQLDQESQL